MEKTVDLKKKMRVIEGFPGPGISYKDITTILSDPDALQAMVQQLADAADGLDFDYVLGTESRGFIVGVPVAAKLHKGFIMARKPGKLPGNLVRKSYTLEYGEASIEVDRDSIPNGARVLVMDDLLATGGTAKTACELVEAAGGVVAGTLFLTELTELGGRKALEDAGYEVRALLTWTN
ncbi:adenine phosphoribosyltransferase [Levyella massiliensis]|uniref:adenine phosphoribosyltransferase n=1 Tax=Levyella massiliensis TaxID=938289 RepID=UPI00258FF4D5|nr:adenine phosphoribosyltransferase [uncultured Levyella sp.]